MADLKITALHKSYGTVHAVRGIDLEIPAGEFTVLVGPSGCGKSTLLRTIAGLEAADAGTIEIGGRVVNYVRPRDRDIAMVFQNYALYPYMNVFENIAFGLRARKTPAAGDRATGASRGGHARRSPLCWTGCRASSRAASASESPSAGPSCANARLFLFDEPLSNLDAQLRDEMRSEIKRLHQEIGTTMIYVTHDQIEAMTLADRIVLLREGQIEQQGTPLDLFERPVTRFVAGFLGSPKMNFVPANVVGSADGIGLKLKDGKSLALPAGSRSRYGAAIGSEVIVGIRPEHMARARDGQPANGHVRLDTAVELIQPTGSRTYITFSLGETSVMAEVEPHDVQKPGEPIAIDLDLNRAVLIDPQTSRVI